MMNEITREEVWLKAWTTSLTKIGNDSHHAVADANVCLKAFYKRFPLALETDVLRDRIRQKELADKAIQLNMDLT